MTKPFEPTQEQVISRWHDQAAGYDILIDTWPHFREMGDRLIRMLPEGFDGHVLDIGGGTGLIAEGVLKQHPRAKITLIEPAEDMCVLAIKRLGTKIDVVKGTAEECPAMEVPANAAIANVAFHLMDETTALPAISLMLQSDSIFAANLWGHSFEETAHFDKRVAWKDVLNSVLGSRGLPIPPTPKMVMPRQRKRAELSRIASECGFNLAEVSIQVRNESVHASIDFAAMHPAFLGDLDPELRLEVMKETKSNCDEPETFSWVELRFERA